MPIYEKRLLIGFIMQNLLCHGKGQYVESKTIDPTVHSIEYLFFRLLKCKKDVYVKV